ncbi:MAG: CheR family methyltransferase, partial [Myxococcaceae bacterium]
DARQFRALEARILPDLLATARREARQGLVWSAGCATGEEPYSLAIAAVELGARPSELDIWATDLNSAAVDNAKLGRYPRRRMVGLSVPRVKRFFSPFEDGFEVDPKLREYIRFDGQNLAAPVFPKVIPGSLDLILCRNVIIYFDLATIRGLMDRFLDSLRPGGVLLLGYSESLFKVYDRFQMIEVEGSFVYRRPVPGEAPPEPPRPALPRPVPRSRPGEPAPPAPKRPAGYVSKTTPMPAAPPLRPGAGPPGAPGARLERAVELMQRGDFPAALGVAKKLAEDEATDLDALITLGNIYSLMGHNDQSRDAFTAALACEPLCVEARVFGGVASLQAGELKEAKGELTKALFLEPTLSLGHYLLAQVYERLGEHEQARRSYRNAIAQLRFPQRALAGHYPDMPDSVDTIARAARYALAALEES